MLFNGSDLIIFRKVKSQRHDTDIMNLPGNGSRGNEDMEDDREGKWKVSKKNVTLI